tara:strand:- start:4407 stop:6071 length:1665 start_codon:yes stop_codon:yes gene_type:complete
MKLTDSEILELHDLFDGLVENNLSIKDKERLQKLLEDSDEARKHYIRFMDMSTSIAHYAEEVVGGDSEDEVILFPLKEKMEKFLTPILAFAAVIAVGVYISLNFTSTDFLTENDEISAESEGLDFGDSVTNDFTLAVMTKSVGVKWSNETWFRPSLGSTLEPSVLQIDEGLVQLEFLKGSTVILEGPVNFELINSNEGSLSSGKLRATVPEVARGFTINLPKGKLIDLGTEFGLSVHNGGSAEIYVYRGNVLYAGENESGEEVEREVSGGQALFVDPNGFSNWVEMPSEAFIGTADIAFRSKEESQNRHASWVQLSEEIAQNANTSLYYSFDHHSPWARALQNQSSQIQDSLNGAIIGCTWSEGRWPGKGALVFKRKNDRVRLDFNVSLQAFTLSAWIKIDKLKDKMSPILCSESLSSGSGSWFINQKGQVVLEVSRGSKKDMYQSAVAFRSERMGRWVHVATSFDLSKRKVSHFVNGRSFSHEKIRSQIPVSFSNSSLGYCSKAKPFKRQITLQGSMDELAIFKTSMPESEIRRMYEIGCPYEATNFMGPNFP